MYSQGRQGRRGPRDPRFPDRRDGDGRPPGDEGAAVARPGPEVRDARELRLPALLREGTAPHHARPHVAGAEELGAVIPERLEGGGIELLGEAEELLPDLAGMTPQGELDTTVRTDVPP